MSANKTEQPTPKRLRDARKEGQTAKSQEISLFAAIVPVFAYVWIAFDWIVGKFDNLFALAATQINQTLPDALSTLSDAAFRTFCMIALPPAFLAGLTALAANLTQTGFIFSFKPLTPNLDNLNPAKWFKKTFSKRNAFEFVKTAIKIAFLAYLCGWTVYCFRSELATLPNAMPEEALELAGAVVYETVKWLLVALAVLAAVDCVAQRYFFAQGMKMSKEEVRREYREMGGDPHIKMKRRQLQQEIAMNDTVARTRKASVLVTNPTHYAVAIRYEQDETPLPIIEAMGEGALAKAMIRAAEEEGIPIMRNVPLAHELWEQGTAGDYIPSDLIEPVAEVIRWLAEMRENTGGNHG